MVWLVLCTPSGELGLALEAWTAALVNNMTRLSFPISLFLSTITSIMDTSTLTALSSLKTMPYTVCDGRNNPTYSPHGGVFVI